MVVCIYTEVITKKIRQKEIPSAERKALEKKGVPLTFISCREALKVSEEGGEEEKKNAT